jgi:hypothetical protein
MVNAEELKEKLVPGKIYRITTRWGDEVVEYRGIGAPGSDRQDPVFRSPGLVTSMIPWPAIEKIEPIEGSNL